jgi:heat shock protein HtpX
MTLIQGVINAFVMFLARIVAFFVDQALRSGSDREERGGGLGSLAHFAVVMVCEIVFGILGSLVVSAFSRWREYRADAGSAKMAGKRTMIQSLKALQRSQESLLNGNKEFSAMKISSKTSWLALFSTHPSLEDRIAALEKLPM